MPDKNPYAAPSAHVDDISQAIEDGPLIPGGRSVPSGHGWQWIVAGFELFKMSPGVWIVNIIILMLILIVLAVIPFIGTLASNLLFPVFMGGLMLGCSALMHDQPLEVGHLVAGFRDKLGSLMMIGVLYLLGLVVIGIVVMLVFGFGIFTNMFSGRDNPVDLTMVLLMLLLVLGLIVPLLMATWFAPALVVFHSLQPLEAMKQSFQGGLRNIVPFLLYGIISGILGLIAAIPFLLGFLVWGPVIVGSVYAGYRDIYLQR